MQRSSSAALFLNVIPGKSPTELYLALRMHSNGITTPKTSCFPNMEKKNTLEIYRSVRPKTMWYRDKEGKNKPP